MNLILFESEKECDIPIDDPRILHLRSVLGMKDGDRFDIGIVNGPRGKAKIQSIESDRMTITFELEKESPKLHPIHLICSYTRPAAASRILREMTTLGVSSMSFFIAEKAEKSYADSKIWKGGEYRRFLLEGAAQAFCTMLPEVNLCSSLEECLAIDNSLNGIALDNYESTLSLADCETKAPVVFAIGPERGWSASERSAFRNAEYTIADMGERVLRSDTACIAAASVLISKLKIL